MAYQVRAGLRVDLMTSSIGSPPQKGQGLTSGGMITGWVVLLIALAGALVYALSANPKMQELGRLAYACGLLAACIALAGKTMTLLGGR